MPYDYLSEGPIAPASRDRAGRPTTARSTIKRVSLVRLRHDVPRATCIARWEGAHADVVRALDGIVEYTVDVAARRRPRDGWDAVATLRFQDGEALRRFEEDPGVQERLRATRVDFIEAVDAFLVDEHVLIPRGGAS